MATVVGETKYWTERVREGGQSHREEQSEPHLVTLQHLCRRSSSRPGTILKNTSEDEHAGAFVCDDFDAKDRLK